MKLFLLVLTLFASPARSQGEVKHVKHLREPRLPTPGPSPANQALPGVPGAPKLVSEGKKAKPSAVGVPKKEIPETEAAQIGESVAATTAADVLGTIDTMPHIRSAEKDVGEVERSAHRPGVHGGRCRPGVNCNHGKETEAAQIGASVAATTAADVFQTNTIATGAMEAGAAQAAEAAQTAVAAQAAAAIHLR